MVRWARPYILVDATGDVKKAYLALNRHHMKQEGA